MNSQEQLFLSSYIVKSAFNLGPTMLKFLSKGVTSAAKPLARNVLGSPAAKAVAGLDDAMRAMPTQGIVAGTPALQRAAARGAAGLHPQGGMAGLVDETPARLIQRSSGSYARKPILTNVPDGAPAAGAFQHIMPTSGAAIAPTLAGLPAAAAPALAAAAPSGLALARQGIGQVASGLGQAARTGAGAVATGVGTAASAAGRGLAATGRGALAVAKNPFVAGLAGGALGAGLVSSSRGGQPASLISAPTETPAAATPAAATTAAATPAAATPAAENAPATDFDSQIAFHNYGGEAPAASNPFENSSNVAQPASADPFNNTSYAKPNLDAVFKKYMGNYTNGSRVDQAKMDYLRKLQADGVDLVNPRAADIYNPANGYGNW